MRGNQVPEVPVSVVQGRLPNWNAGVSPHTRLLFFLASNNKEAFRLQLQLGDATWTSPTAMKKSVSDRGHPLIYLYPQPDPLARLFFNTFHSRGG